LRNLRNEDLKVGGWANAGVTIADNERHAAASVMLGLVPSICGIAN
jgi:hypothetical protein